MKKQINSNELLRIPVRPNACINGLYVSVMRCSRLLNAMRHSYIQSLSTASASSPVALAMDAASSPICLRFLATVEGLLHADRVPEPFVGRQLSVAERGFFERVHCLLQFGVFQQLLRHLARPLVYLGEVPEPQHLHPLLAVGVGVELREFDEYQVQPVYHLLRMLDVYKAVVVVEFPELGLEYFVYEVQGVYGLEEGIVVSLFDLPHVRFRRVEQDALAELLRPYHLHLHDEVPSPVVPAPDVHDAVLPEGVVGNHFCREVFKFRDLLSLLERELLNVGSAFGFRYFMGFWVCCSSADVLMAVILFC